MPTPILLFTYNRPQHTLKVLESLAQNPEITDCPLIIFIDGPKKPEHQALTDEVARVALSKPWSKHVEIVKRTENFGCPKSVITEVSKYTEQYGQVIVLEDDILVSPYFLDYMLAALDKYRDNPNVMEVSGYRYPTKGEIQRKSGFLPHAHAWGWATWHRAWQHFEKDGSKLLSVIKDDPVLLEKFTLGGALNMLGLLYKQVAGEVGGWDIRWCASIVLNGGYALYPSYAVCENIGHDGSGQHMESTDQFAVELATQKIVDFPDKIEIDPDYLIGLKAQMTPPSMTMQQEYYSYAQDQLDVKLLAYINFRSGFYIEVGANNGVNQSNTLFFEKYLGWRGVLIEPIPHRFFECRGNRHKGMNTFICCACVPFDYSDKFVEIAYGDLLSSSNLPGADINAPAERERSGQPFLPNSEIVVNFGAMARTLNNCLDEAKAPKTIDLLSLNVNGSELPVLAGLDFGKYTIKYLLIASRYHEKTVGFLGQYGYRCIKELSPGYLLFTSLQNIA